MEVFNLTSVDAKTNFFIYRHEMQLVTSDNQLIICNTSCWTRFISIFYLFIKVGEHREMEYWLLIKIYLFQQFPSKVINEVAGLFLADGASIKRFF